MESLDPDDLVAALIDLVVSDSTTPAQLQLESGALFACLKGLQRSINNAGRLHKQKTADARLAMDHTHLRLQNLLYERRYLEREIEKCNQFASIYQDVPLHPMEEFLMAAPPNLRADDILENQHQLMLNRLSFELTERHRLEARRKELLTSKETKMREYRDNEKLVNEWFSGGTGVERAITDLEKMGQKVATTLGIKIQPPEETAIPMDVQIELSSPSVSGISADVQPMSTPPAVPQIPTGPRNRS